MVNLQTCGFLFSCHGCIHNEKGIGAVIDNNIVDRIYVLESTNLWIKYVLALRPFDVHLYGLRNKKAKLLWAIICFSCIHNWLTTPDVHWPRRNHWWSQVHLEKKEHHNFIREEARWPPHYFLCILFSLTKMPFILRFKVPSRNSHLWS